MLKLYIDKEEFKVSEVSRITPKIRTEFNKLANKLKVDDVTSQMIKALSDAGMKVVEGKETYENPAKLLEYTSLLQISENPKDFEHNYNIQVEIVKLITVESSVSVKLIEAGFSTESTSDFWQSQDSIEVEAYVNSFRKKFRQII
jgi:hypothetical protein